jgi:phage shock protein A
MGLFRRFRDALKANINDMISKAENPEKMLNQMIIDMNEQLYGAKRDVASAIADEKQLERKMIENETRSQEWERKAVLAVKAQKDDLAKEALLRKQEYLSYANELRPQWEAQHDAVMKLKDSLKQLQHKIEEAGRKKNLLIARAKRAEAQKKIQATMGNLSDTSAFDAFDRMASKVERIEAEADAAAELAAPKSKDASLEAQFKQLESSGGEADFLLEELKSKMKKIEDKSEGSD